MAFPSPLFIWSFGDQAPHTQSLRTEQTRAEQPVPASSLEETADGYHVPTGNIFFLSFFFLFPSSPCFIVHFSIPSSLLLCICLPGCPIPFTVCLGTGEKGDRKSRTLDGAVRKERGKNLQALQASLVPEEALIIFSQVFMP